MYVISTTAFPLGPILLCLFENLFQSPVPALSKISSYVVAAVQFEAVDTFASGRFAIRKTRHDDDFV